MPDRDFRGPSPVRVGLATGAIVAISLTLPVSASLAAPDVSGKHQEGQARQKTPAPEAAPPTGTVSVPAPVGGPPGPSGVTAEPSEPAVGSPDADEPRSQSDDAATRSPKPAQGPAEPARPAEPVSDTVDLPGETAAPAGVDVGANGSIAATGADGELAPDEGSSAETVTASPAADTSAGSPRVAAARRAASHIEAAPAFARTRDGASMTCLASPVSCAALQPDPVELRTRPGRPSARPRAERATRRGDGAPRNLPVRMPRAPDSAVCSASGACAAAPLGMMPVLAALGFLGAFIFERLLQLADGWRPHRFVSLRERPG